jgi:hypothetical protein
MKKGYITILDIENGKTHIYQFWLNEATTIQEHIISKGFDLKKIHYMITDTIKFQIY